MSDSAIVGDKSTLPIHAKRKADTTFDRIWKYYYMIDKQVVLNEKEERIRQRWEYTWLLDCTLLNKMKIARRLQKKFGISIQLGYVDVNNARLLFSDPTRANKAAQRAIMSNLLEGQIRKAIAANDFKSVERLIGRYEKLNGLAVEQDDPMADFMKKLRPAQIVFSADEKTLKKQAAQMMADVQDTDFEDINDAGSEEAEFLS